MKRRDLKVQADAGRVPFSMGEIVDVLQAAGLATDDAIRIARDAEKHFRTRGQRVIPLPELTEWLRGGIQDRVGTEAASRFLQGTPPFVPLRLERGGSVEQFSSRTLASSLEAVGLGFKEAWAAARQVERLLRAEGLEQVSEGDLVRFTAQVLETLHGRETRLRYEEQVEFPTVLKVEEADGSDVPFSQGVLARSLMSVGLGPELSHTLARHVESSLWSRERRRIDRQSLREEVAALLREEAGEEFAQRYELLRTLRSPEKPLIVLIGGTAGVGKSSLASELGYRLGIPRIVSTDAVRQALRSLIGPDLSPSLHSSSFTAWRAELLPSERENAKPKRKRVIRGFLSQVNQLRPALDAIIERSIQEATSLVMEGIHLVPGISPGTTFAGATVIELVLVVEDETSHRNHFGFREGKTGAQRLSSSYLDHFGEIRTLQRFIQVQAGLVSATVIDAVRLDQAVDRAMESILEVLLRNFQAQREGGARVSEEESDRVVGTSGGA